LICYLQHRVRLNDTSHTEEKQQMLRKLDYLERILARSITQRLLVARVLCNAKFARYIELLLSEMFLSLLS